MNAPTPAPLPEGLIEADGVIQFKCKSCGAWTEWHGEPEEFELGAAENVCGGTQWCLP